MLVTGEELIDHMIKYKIGVRDTDKVYTISEVDMKFFEEEI